MSFGVKRMEMLHREPEPAKLPTANLKIVTGDLLKQDVEVIVNAWNRNWIPYYLLLPQGVSGAIKREAGLGPFKELRKLGVLELGQAALTSAGRLPFEGIIHVAGINHLWIASEKSVRDSARNALALAEEKGFESIAFPAIGAGSLGGVTVDDSLRIIAEEVSKSSYSGRVVLVRFEKPKFD